MSAEQTWCAWPRESETSRPARTRAHASSKPWDARGITLLKRNVVIYEGPSQLTGDPILVVASGKTSNRKIGAMVQLWILTAALSPLEAVKVGADRAICGDCTLRGDGTGQQRACYVEWWRAPENIHQALPKADRLEPDAFARLTRGMQLRIGAYGDPMAVPLDVWRPLLKTAAGWTGYTHHWRRAEAEYATFLMASVDSPAEQDEAAALGWRTFRVRAPSADVRPNEVICPASEEAGHVAVCAECSLCRGTARSAKHGVIVAHGQRAKWFGTARPTADPQRPRLVKHEVSVSSLNARRSAVQPAPLLRSKHYQPRGTA